VTARTPDLELQRVAAQALAGPPREPTAAMFIAGTRVLADAPLSGIARHVWYAMHDAWTTRAAADSARPVPAGNYVQPVPDHCDRIVWRGQYYGLPLTSTAQPPCNHDLLCVSREFRFMLDAELEGMAHEDGWTLLRTEDAEALKRDALAYRAQTPLSEEKV
jgi:hypothetical protein